MTFGNYREALVERARVIFEEHHRGNDCEECLGRVVDMVIEVASEPKASVDDASAVPCPTCDGTGNLKLDQRAPDHLSEAWDQKVVSDAWKTGYKWGVQDERKRAADSASDEALLELARAALNVAIFHVTGVPGSREDRPEPRAEDVVIEMQGCREVYERLCDRLGVSHDGTTAEAQS